MKHNLGQIVNNSFAAIRKSLPLTAVRISPAGALGIAIGTSDVIGTAVVLISGNAESPVVRDLAWSQLTVILPIFGYSAVLYSFGAHYYKEARSMMRHPTAREHIGLIVTDNVLRYYCTRNGYHAAAVRTGLSGEFSRMMSTYKGVKENSFLPGV